MATGNGCPYEDSVGAAGLLYLSLRKFVSFSKFLGLLVDGFEKEITTSMSKLDVKKQFLLPFFFNSSEKFFECF